MNTGIDFPLFISIYLSPNGNRLSWVIYELEIGFKCEVQRFKK